MKSVWISVFLLLSVVELEATSASQFSCLKRNLTVSVDDILWLYIDGIEITGLPNSNFFDRADVVNLPCYTRLIAIKGRNKYAIGPAGILASTGDDYVLTNSSWKCSNVSHIGWEQIDFDDSAWTPAVELKSWVFITGTSLNAVFIWLRESISDNDVKDLEVFCRKKLDPSYCTFSPCAFGGICIEEANGGGYCICAPGYAGPNCSSDINECLLVASNNECDPSMGKCINFFGGYNCSCYEGYTNDGSKRCSKASTSQYSTSSIILGVFFGVSVLVIIALISALWFLHLRKKTVNYEGMIDEGQIDVHHHIQPNDIAPVLGQNGVNSEINLISDAEDNAEPDPAPYEYPGLRVFVQ